ncbi:MAG: DinB family protein [Acidobacteriota bacterium]
MPLSEALLPEFDQEMAHTRRTIERVPEDRLGWKPHEKSPTMLWLAGHLATLPLWGVVTIEKDSIDLAAPMPRPPEPGTRQELLEAFDRNAAAARTLIAGATDERLLQPWSLLMAGRTVFTLPRIAVLRTMVMNHLIHHRAQLCVYLRLNDVAVPAIYGPSADEAAM